MYIKQLVLGRLGADPVIKYTQSGTPVANFTVAVDDRYKDNSGVWQDKTEWVSVVAWKDLAENVGKYLTKGSLVFIEGKPQTRSWEDKSSGEKKYKTELVASVVKFLDSKKQQDQLAKDAATDDDSPF